MSETVQALMETPLGQILSSSEASELTQAAKTRSIGRNQALFRLGEQSSNLYVILTGSVEVELGGSGASRVIVATLGPGQIVGELEVMTGSLRMASVIATEETTLLELTAGKLDEMQKNNRPSANKLVASIAKTLARRLTAVNQRIMDRTNIAPSPTVSSEVKTAAKREAVAVADEDLDVLDKLWG